MQRITTIAAIVGATYGLLLLLERLLPLRRPSRPLLGRLAVNVATSALAIGTAAVLVRPTAEFMLNWTGNNRFGLLHLGSLPPAIDFILSFLLMDLSFYYWHRANHGFRLLWRFHNAHHIDPDLDVSTGFRFHAGEVIYSTGLRVIQVGAIGLSPWAFAVYELCFQIATLFEHSNIRLPIRMERVLVRILVTPRMHGIHHSQIRQETNSNYCTVFTCWDWLHRTLRLDVPQSEIEIGVPGYSLPEDDELKNVLFVPLRPQRKYWPESDDSVAASRRAAGAVSRWHLEA